MEKPNVHSSLIPLLTTYRDYFTRAETDTSRGCYAAVLCPYHINTANVATSIGPYEVTLKIYATEKEEIITAFLQ